jgi:hypothetical protein
MTECPSANALAELIDGTITAARRTAIESHLDHCLACTELVGELAGAAMSGVVARQWREPRIELVRRWRAVIAKVATNHRAGVVHGGLSPDGIAISEGGEISIANAPSLACTAIDQLHGARPSAAGDQFALCACLWEALAGTPPFRGTTPGALAVVMMTRPEPPDADPIFGVLVRGLAADPAARWPDLDALAAAIDHPPRQPRGRLWLIAIIAIIAIAGATWLVEFR